MTEFSEQDRPPGVVARLLGPAFAERDFALLWVGLLGENVSLQMLEMIIGWQLYSYHHSPLDLGFIGLAEFIPMFVLALPCGALADRLPRRLVFMVALLLQTLVAAALVAVSLLGARLVWPFLTLAVWAGVAMALGSPASRALPASLVPARLLPSAMTVRSIAIQGAAVIGPALGGLLYPVGPALVYAVAGVQTLIAAGAVAMLRETGPGAPRHDPGVASEPDPGVAGEPDPGVAGEPDPAGAPRRAQEDPVTAVGGGPEKAQRSRLSEVLDGVRFVSNTPILLGAIMLDLLAVLFGGAVALLPVFARSVLHVGPIGLGVLRSSPAIGAVLAGALLTRRPLGGRTGRTLLVAVGVFGLSMVVFGLSRSFAISLLALGVSGFADLYSMSIRGTTTALATPDRLRGRVLAVEMVFISASNQLGAFESGLAAFLIGAVPAVVLGGALTVGLAAGWGRLFPALARVDRLEDVGPAAADPGQ